MAFWNDDPETGGWDADGDFHPSPEFITGDSVTTVPPTESDAQPE
jgi:hypothetical protein